MKRSRFVGLLACVLVLFAAGGARAQEVPAQEPGPREHQFTFYSRAGALAYLSDARTTGGAGAGVGLRDTLHERFILQADLSYLMMLGNVGVLRLGAGVQRSGTYTPAVLLTLTSFFGDRLAFLTPEHPTPVGKLAMALGVSVAPLRFTHQGLQMSLLELGVGVGSDLPGLGLSYQLGLLEVGTAF
ncbi:MAG TPA: hypothetical protein VE057_03585 [Archangium sp.]|nr:hypothetical protein [Archangium sp.]